MACEAFRVTEKLRLPQPKIKPWATRKRSWVRGGARWEKLKSSFRRLFDGRTTNDRYLDMLVRGLSLAYSYRLPEILVLYFLWRFLLLFRTYLFLCRLRREHFLELKHPGMALLVDYLNFVFWRKLDGACNSGSATAKHTDVTTQFLELNMDTMDRFNNTATSTIIIEKRLQELLYCIVCIVLYWSRWFWLDNANLSNPNTRSRAETIIPNYR